MLEFVFYLHIILTLLGVGLIFSVCKIYKPFKTFENNRTLIAPFLLVGFFVATSGVTEFIGPFFGMEVLHSLLMIFSTFFTILGFYKYQKILEKIDVISYAKEVSKLVIKQNDKNILES